MQGVSFIELEVLKISKQLFFPLEVKYKLLVILVPVADLNAISVGIFDLIHGQPLQTYYFRRVPPLLVRLRQN